MIGLPQKKKIIAFDRSYHGVTLAATALTGLPVMHTHFDVPVEALGILRAETPHYYHGRDDGETEIEFVDRLIDDVESLITKEGADAIAAFVAEPVIPDFMYQAMIEPSAEVGVFGHGYTYTGHPVACAAALKAIEIYRREKLFDHAADVGEYMQKRLREFTEHPLVGEVRGRGLIAAVELVADKRRRIAFGDGRVGAQCKQFCEDHGLLIRAVSGNCIAFCPPLIITPEQIDEMIAMFATALQETLEWVNKQNLLQ